ncbi:MAG: hypothetical protein GY822_09100 [Deltaproteobacteria bacterium]|nr:hypothetical protein [Deltaproteobacteria bacterium]
MSVLSSSVPKIPVALLDALEADIGTLLVDDDVTRVHLRSGGFRVCRRGRWETLDAKALSVFDALKSLFVLADKERDQDVDDDVTLRFDLAAGGMLFAEREHQVEQKARSDDEDRPIFVVVVLEQRRVRLLKELVQEGFLDEQSKLEILQAVSGGAHFFVLGPSAPGASRLLWSLVAELETAFSFGAQNTLGLPHVLPVASVDKGVELELDASVVLELEPAKVISALTSLRRHGLFASVPIRSVVGLDALIEDGSFAVFFNAVVAVVGLGPNGAPRLVELHLPQTSMNTVPQKNPQDVAAWETTPNNPLQGAGSKIRPAPVVVEERTFLEEPRSSFKEDLALDLPPLLPLPDAPPADWDAPPPSLDTLHAAGEAGEMVGNDVLNMHKDSLEPDAESKQKTTDFASTLAAVRERPGFKPRRPTEHPQSAKLKADPFGGLSLEPPFDSESNGPDDEDTSSSFEESLIQNTFGKSSQKDESAS